MVTSRHLFFSKNIDASYIIYKPLHIEKLLTTTSNTSTSKIYSFFPEGKDSASRPQKQTQKEQDKASTS